MNLKISLPQKILLQEEVLKVKAEGSQGHFCLLPRHIDTVSTLVPGILAYYPASGGEHFVAVNTGLLLKIGPEVLVAVDKAVSGPLGELEQAVSAMLVAEDEYERQARTAVARLEADFVRRFTGFAKNV